MSAMVIGVQSWSVVDSNAGFSQVADAPTIEGGAVAFLQKSVDQDKLMAAVQQVVGTT